MDIIIAMDSFKGSLTSLEAGQAAAAALAEADGTARVTVYPLADGGEGLLEALLSRGGSRREVMVSGPLGQPLTAAYGLLPSGAAVIEAAQANGLTLLPEEQRDPAHTTSYGVGELIARAVDHGCRDIILGLGGSATNDGGLGMLQALGAAFYDEQGRPLGREGWELTRLARIDCSGLRRELASCRIRAACDVNNPLTGPAGCSAVFGPQKGGSPEALAVMDMALAHYADLTAAALGHDRRQEPGAGAAGGLGFALVSYLGAQLCPGAALVMEALGLPEAISRADMVITGEGRLDGQTAMGKGPGAVAALAAASGAVALAFAGQVTASPEQWQGAGFDGCWAITPPDMELSRAMTPEIARDNLYQTIKRVFASFTMTGANSGEAERTGV